MTTQHTHHEQSDVDALVSEHPPVPETTVAPTVFETVTSAEAGVQTSTSASELVVPVDAQEVHCETPALPVEGHQIEVEHLAQDFQEERLPEKTLAVESEAVSVPTEKSLVFSYIQSGPLEAPEEEVRPFTAFIEEFRQAEARLSASVQESEVEAFTLLSSTEISVTTPEAQNAQEANGFRKEAFEAKTPEPTPVQEASVEENVKTAAPEQVEESKKETTQRPTNLPPTERTISPLLRPATRLRIPRHGTVRHQREEKVAEMPELIPRAEAQEPSTPSVPVEPPAEPTPQRPARRYRFDRPASSNGIESALPVSPVPPAPVLPQVQVEEKHDLPARPSSTLRIDVGQSASEQVAEVQTKPTVSIASAVQQEALITEGINTSEPNRRRQGQERQKEQAVAPVTLQAPVPVIEPGPTLTEPAAQTSGIAPEDLPPLEYSELQKATSRRRRRHRAGANSSANVAAVVPVPAPVMPVMPVALPTPPPPVTMPRVPSIPNNPAASAPYTIVSGYTVSQMNQGNEASGPFLGPEPSPARGSVVTRDGRTARAEAQRPPTYPARAHEAAAPSVASINHFANVVSQAIQTQTDRMVAELRRTSQAPTNVSVSLPPFPSTERVGVFVDVANLLYSARTLRIAVDFGKLLDFLRGNRRLVRAHAYCPTSPQPGDEQMFLQAVKGLGYRITTKNYKTFSSGAKKADLDLDLCMDVVRLVDGRAVDCVVLVSGDSDFMPMLDYCSDHGVRVEVAAFDEAMSATLRQSCDLFVNLSMLEEIRA